MWCRSLFSLSSTEAVSSQHHCSIPVRHVRRPISDILARMSRGYYEETASVEFKLFQGVEPAASLHPALWTVGLYHATSTICREMSPRLLHRYWIISLGDRSTRVWTTLPKFVTQAVGETLSREFKRSTSRLLNNYETFRTPPLMSKRTIRIPYATTA